MYNCTVRKETLQHSTVIDFSSHNCCVSMLSAWTSNCEHRVFWLPSWINGWPLFYTVLTKYYLEALSCPTCDSYPDNFFLQVLIFWPGVIVWNSFPSPPISSCCIKENRKSVTPLLLITVQSINPTLSSWKPPAKQLWTHCHQNCAISNMVYFLSLQLLLMLLLVLLLLLPVLFLFCWHCYYSRCCCSFCCFLVSSVTVLVLSLSRQW